MSKTRFTPGPWPVEPTGDGKRIIVGRGLVDGPGGYEVAEVYSDDCDREEASANAHLIAAAPELYEALIEAKSEMRDWGIDHPAMKQIDAALRKARGEA